MRILAVLTILAFLASPAPLRAAEGGTPPPDINWSFDGVFGTFDRAELQRGFQVYRQVCAACHSLNRIAFRNLADLGYTEGQIKAIAQEYSVEDGPNDEGEMFIRPALISDYFPAPYPNKQAAKYVNNGAYPPDLSLIANARSGGANYLYGLMIGYHEAPEGTELLAGQYWNEYMPGHVIAMPPPLADGQVMYEDDAPQTVQQYAHDVAAFLTWASNPELEKRKRTGTKVFLYLLVFTFVMYGVKKKIWKNAH